MKLGLVAAAFGLGGALSGAAFAWPALEQARVLGRAVEVGDFDAPRDGSLRRWVEGLAPRLAEREAYLALPEGTLLTTFGELGIRLDVEATLAEIRRATPSVGFFADLRRLFSDQEPPRAPLVFRFEEDVARAWLEARAAALYREPRDARLDLVAHRRLEERPGRSLDVSSTLATIARGERKNLAVFPATFVPLEPAVRSSDLADVDVSRVLSSFETDFSKKPRSRIPNIRTAARYLNGVVVGPGEVLSFNRVVGERSAERGFTEAPVIVADELERGLGGGVCQVASTLFGAAMLGGFEIVSRRSHSRPSGYAPLGLDAVVIYDENIDLKLKNPYDTPVIVHAFLPNQKVLRVELLGRDPPGKIEHFFHVERRDPFTRRVAVKPELAPGTIDRRQEGNRGYEGTSTLVIHLPDGTRKTRRYSSKYYPVPEVFWIAADVWLDALPPLPEGATDEPVRAEEQDEELGETFASP